MFDFVAVNTYLTVSGLFWFTGLIPDLAAGQGPHPRGFAGRSTDSSPSVGRGRIISGAIMAGPTFCWQALATPLVISVHSVVSWDFALAIIPGYHSTIFAPYFVAGAIQSGLSMVLTLLIPLRRIFGFQKLIPVETLESIAKMMIFMSLIIGYSYLVEYLWRGTAGTRSNGTPFSGGPSVTTARSSG